MDLVLVEQESKDLLRKVGEAKFPIRCYLGHDEIARPLVVIEPGPFFSPLKEPHVMLPWLSIAMFQIGVAHSSATIARAGAKQSRPTEDDIERFSQGHMEPGEVSALIMLEARNDRGDEFVRASLWPYAASEKEVVFDEDSPFSEAASVVEMNEMYAHALSAHPEIKSPPGFDGTERWFVGAWSAFFDLTFGIGPVKVWADKSVVEQIRKTRKYEEKGIDDKGRIRLVWRDDDEPSVSPTVDGRERSPDE